MFSDINKSDMTYLYPNMIHFDAVDLKPMYSFGKW